MAHGLGTTHVALTLANYVCSKLGMKTAYIELNTSNQINNLVNNSENQVFCYKGIDFFPSASVTFLSEILQKNYRYFVLDIGVLNTYTTKEFLRCDKQFLIGSPCKWKRPQIEEKIEQLFSNLTKQNCFTVIMNLSEKESNSTIFSRYKTVSFPYITNPFHLETRHFHVISQILERN